MSSRRAGAGAVLLVVVFACGRAPPSPSRSASPRTSAATTFIPSETDAQLSRVEEMLRRVPGVEVTRLPDATYQIRIRGQRSLQGTTTSNDPLIVIDGVPMSSAASALAGLAPRDVAQVQVLKDSAPTSQYGSRGANGVIIITTKRASP